MFRASRNHKSTEGEDSAASQGMEETIESAQIWKLEEAQRNEKVTQSEIEHLGRILRK